MSKQTLEQKRAEHAWKKAEEGLHKYDKDYVKKDYVNDAKGLPALIMNSGLMQVMAYLHGKGGRHEIIAEHLRDWLHEQCKTPTKFDDFMQYLMNAGSREFQAITTEAFAWLKWLMGAGVVMARNG